MATSAPAARGLDLDVGRRKCWMFNSMPPRFRFLSALLAAILLLPGCALLPWNLSFRKKKPPRAIARFSQAVGTVVLVSEDPSFVLIDNGPLPPPAPGTVLA